MEMHWSLIIFTLFMCWAAGTFFIQGLMSFKGLGKKSQMLNILVTLVLLIIGGIGVFTHLQHWERIFNGFGHITSGITWELIAVVLLGIVIVIYFLFLYRSEDGTVPKWCSVLAIIFPVFLVCVMSDSYFMPARPAWDTPLLMVYYLANALLLGGFTSIIITAVTRETQGYRFSLKLTLAGAIVSLVALLAYAIYLATTGGQFVDSGYYFDPTLPDVGTIDAGALEASPLDGSLAPVYWILVVIIGCVVPAVLLWRDRKAEKYLKPEAATADEADGSEKKGAKAFFHIGKSLISGKAMGVVSCGLAAVLVGSVGWRCILYVIAASVFAIFERVI